MGNETLCMAWVMHPASLSYLPHWVCFTYVPHCGDRHNIPLELMQAPQSAIVYGDQPALFFDYVQGKPCISVWMKYFGHPVHHFVCERIPGEPRVIGGLVLSRYGAAEEAFPCVRRIGH